MCFGALQQLSNFGVKSGLAGVKNSRGENSKFCLKTGVKKGPKMGSKRGSKKGSKIGSKLGSKRVKRGQPDGSKDL